MKSKKWKYAVIITIAVALDILLHVLTGGYSETAPHALELSSLAEHVGEEGAAILWAVLAFSGVAYVFHRFEGSIKGSKFTKGLRYGIAIGMMWLIAMLEGVALFGNSLLNEFIVGLSDFIPVVVMSVLLSLFTGNNESTRPASSLVKRRKNPDMKKLASQRKNLLTLIVFATLFLVGRYVAYHTELIMSGYRVNGLSTAVWTFFMGLTMGAAYLLLHHAVKDDLKIMKSVTFGICIFGTTWLLFICFMPLLFKGFLVDVLVRVAIDVTLVIISAYCCELLLSDSTFRKGRLKYERESV
ncbi:hypothetical protein [Anoxynatronum buryatiense]|nr:hypothetical protein [Anoxynatronum buryatiense]